MVQGQIMALCAALLTAVGTSLYNRMGDRLTSDMIGYVRMFLAVPMSVVLVLIFDGNLPFGYPWQTYLFAFGSGFVGYFLCDYFMFKAIVGLGARETAVIMTLNPALTALLSLFLFREYLEELQIAGMVVTVFGIALMITGSRGSSEKSVGMSLRTGFLCALAGAVLQSVADVMAKYALSSLPSVSTNLLRLIGGLAAWIVFGFFRRTDYRRQFKAFSDRRYVVMMVCASAAGPVFGMTLSIGAMNLIPVGVVKSLVQTSPIFLIPIDLIRKKKITGLSVIGTLISVAGVILLF